MLICAVTLMSRKLAQRKPMTASSDLPFGSEFSPTILHLPDLLEIAKKCVGDREWFERGWGNDEVAMANQRPFSQRSSSDA